MLVLRRKAAEALVINGAVTICILAIEGDRVKVGIIAPPDVLVARGELLSLPAQQYRLRRKQEALAREKNPEQRARLAASIARLEQSMHLLQPAIAPESGEAREEAKP